MQSDYYSILVVDDEDSIRRLLQKELASPRRRIHTAASATEGLRLCHQESFEVILLDIRLDDGNGLDLLPDFLRLLPDAKIIMITGYADLDGAVTAMRNGAYDFVAKPFTLSKLELIVERAFEHTSLACENRSLRLASGNKEHALVGNSLAMRDLVFLLKKVGPTDVPVLITGESGTGKDVVAAEIHRASARRTRPFVVKNCAGLQKELARSELFGHVKGSFTNALESTEGLMTFANRGTLFLDEVGELPLEVQALLLRVLENQRYRRVGEKDERNANVRFLFATNRNLADEVQRGNFHEALYHRINVFQISLPALKERREDIPLLVAHFLAQLGGDRARYSISPEAMNCLMHYHWPGNVRELRNVIERGLILAENNIISEKTLPRDLVESVAGSVSRPAPSLAPATTPSDGRKKLLPASRRKIGGESMLPGVSLLLDDVERGHIAQVLAMFGGNKQKVAKALGIARKTLYRRLKTMGLE
ncbi:MAG: sigma-54 dependent transcriptional regulator [Proteobacteria bacterium]|nr:sigma-54 dependent transcriptional regulator [Pseudomonadota bacterium]